MSGMNPSSFHDICSRSQTETKPEKSERDQSLTDSIAQAAQTAKKALVKVASGQLDEAVTVVADSFTDKADPQSKLKDKTGEAKKKVPIIPYSCNPLASSPYSMGELYLQMTGEMGGIQELPAPPEGWTSSAVNIRMLGSRIGATDELVDSLVDRSLRIDQTSEGEKRVFVQSLKAAAGIANTLPSLAEQLDITAPNAFDDYYITEALEIRFNPPEKNITADYQILHPNTMTVVKSGTLNIPEGADRAEIFGKWEARELVVNQDVDGTEYAAKEDYVVSITFKDGSSKDMTIQM